MPTISTHDTRLFSARLDSSFLRLVLAILRAAHRAENYLIRAASRKVLHEPRNSYARPLLPHPYGRLCQSRQGWPIRLVVLQNSSRWADLPVRKIIYAALRYSLIMPPSTFRRRIGASSDVTTGSSESGGRCRRDWWGRWQL